MRLLMIAVCMTALMAARNGKAEEAVDLTPRPTATPRPASELDATLNSHEERLSELEATGLMQHIRLSGFLVNRAEAIQYVPGNDQSKATRVYPLLLRFGLNVDAKISDSLKVYSRIGASKIFNNNAGSSTTMPTLGDASGSFAHTSSSLYLDRAYVDYHLPWAPLVLSVGRLPTENGPPANLLDGLPRDGSYPRMLYNSIFDGAALSLNLAKVLPEGHNLSLRFAYTPFSQIDNARPFAPLTTGGETLSSQSGVYNGLVDYSLAATKYFGPVSFIFQVNYFPSSKMVMATPGGTFVSKDTFILAATYLEANDIGHSGFDVALSCTLNRAEDTTTGPNPITGEPVTSSYTQSGSVFLALLRYQIPVPAINRPYVGAEYLTSSERSMIPDLAADDLTSFYSTKGRAFHLFYTQPLTAGLILRAGYRLQNSLFGSGGFGLGDQDRVRTWYLNLRVDF
jgi:hypothetical protein